MSNSDFDALFERTHREKKRPMQQRRHPNALLPQALRGNAPEKRYTHQRNGTRTSDGDMRGTGITDDQFRARHNKLSKNVANSEEGDTSDSSGEAEEPPIAPSGINGSIERAPPTLRYDVLPSSATGKTDDTQSN